jgi:hypothetical protein
MTQLEQNAALRACVECVRAFCRTADGKIVCHAEGEDGVMSAVMLFQRAGKVVLKFPDAALTDALFAAWHGAAKSGAPWASALLTIEIGEAVWAFEPPQTYVFADVERRIPDLAFRHFGAKSWDDSAPEPDTRKPWWRVW